MMASAEVQGKTDADAMDYIVSQVKANGSEWTHMQERHPLEMDDLRLIRDAVLELKQQGADLREYTILGNRVVQANFEGNWIDDGKGGERRERLQPWWDKGYVIDIFFIVIFCVSVIIAVKRLPDYGWEPRHDKH